MALRFGLHQKAARTYCAKPCGTQSSQQASGRLMFMSIHLSSFNIEISLIHNWSCENLFCSDIARQRVHQKGNGTDLQARDSRRHGWGLPPAPAARASAVQLQGGEAGHRGVLPRRQTCWVSAHTSRKFIALCLIIHLQRQPASAQAACCTLSSSRMH